MKTTAAVLRSGHGPFTIEELDLEEPRADEAVIRMVATGMCHTDLLTREIPSEAYECPSVFGHEGAGVVEAVGSDVTHVSPGDHVVLSFAYCGDCRWCNDNKPFACATFIPRNLPAMRIDGSSALTDADGKSVRSHFFGQSSFATYAVVAANSVVKVDPSYDLKKLGPLGCGFQTGAGAIMNTLDVPAGSSVAIGGVGALGLTAVMAAKLRGASSIIAVDRHQNRLELATKYGATHTVSGSPEEINAQILEITGGGADYAFDSTGAPDVVKAMIESTHNAGVIAIAGIHFGPITLDYMSLVSSRIIKGVIEGGAKTHEFIPYLAKLNADGEFPYDELIVEYPFSEINAAEAASKSGEVIKPLIVF